MTGRRIAALGAAVCLLAAGLCIARNDTPAARKPVHIPAQELAAALRSLARQQGLQIVYRSDVVGHLHTRGASGDLTLDQALQALLRGTGLTYHYLDPRTITVTPAASRPPEPQARPPPRRGRAPGRAASGTRRAGLSGLAPDGSAGSPLQEVVVTAEKMPELASRTPLALSVYSGDALRRDGIDTIADLQNIDPEVSVGQSAAGVNIGIRGVSTTDVTSKGEQDVVFDVDGIPMGRPREMMQSLFDIDRIEVLREGASAIRPPAKGADVAPVGYLAAGRDEPSGEAKLPKGCRSTLLSRRVCPGAARSADQSDPSTHALHSCTPRRQRYPVRQSSSAWSSRSRPAGADRKSSCRKAAT